MKKVVILVGIVFLSMIFMSTNAHAIPVIFEVDATGSVISLDTWLYHNRLPLYPGGDGRVFITGNLEPLAHWYPNFIGLNDDGTGPDSIAGDGIWTRQFDFTLGTEVRYKYTIGKLYADEGRWAGTEEFALTERGFTIPIDDSIAGVTIRDIFADRPAPSGNMGELALITYHTANSVPEPATVFLLAIGCLTGLIGAQKKLGLKFPK